MLVAADSADVRTRHHRRQRRSAGSAGAARSVPGGAGDRRAASRRLRLRHPAGAPAHRRGGVRDHPRRRGPGASSRSGRSAVPSASPASPRHSPVADSAWSTAGTSPRLRGSPHDRARSDPAGGAGRRRTMFDLVDDYPRRLEWDTLLRRAYTVGDAPPDVGLRRSVRPGGASAASVPHPLRHLPAPRAGRGDAGREPAVLGRGRPRSGIAPLRTAGASWSTRSRSPAGPPGWRGSSNRSPCAFPLETGRRLRALARHLAHAGPAQPGS